MENLASSLIVTLIGMSVIFLVLSILWLTIILLDKAFPYRATDSALIIDDTETVAVIQAAIATYLKRKPEDISIKSIK